MKESLQVDGSSVEMNKFIESYLANVCKAILDSLKGTEGANKALFKIEGKNVELVVNDNPVDLRMDRGFAALMVRDTILAVLSHLRGLRKWTQIEVEVVL